MSAVSEIEAAIAILSGLREASLEGPWTRTDELWEGAGRYEVQARNGLVTSDGDGIGSIGNVAEADLIVTLYRTIDAQTEVLTKGAQAIADRNSLTDAYAWDDGEWTRNTSAELVALLFARAINGTA